MPRLWWREKQEIPDRQRGAGHGRWGVESMEGGGAQPLQGWWCWSRLSQGGPAALLPPADRCWAWGWNPFRILRLPGLEHAWSSAVEEPVAEVPGLPAGRARGGVEGHAAGRRRARGAGHGRWKIEDGGWKMEGRPGTKVRMEGRGRKMEGGEWRGARRGA